MKSLKVVVLCRIPALVIKYSASGGIVPQSSDPSAFQQIIFWILGTLGGLVIGVVRFFNSKIDNKVSKDVFKEYKERSEISHSVLKEIRDAQSESAKEIRDTQREIFNKIDGKKDKD